MFYRLKDNEIYDYADYEYSSDCQFTNLCSVKMFEENCDKYVIENGQIVIPQNIDEILSAKRQKQFEKAFFFTSLGWIRRKVAMQDGTAKDFLADLLLPIKAGMELGQNIEIITYNTPDYSKELTPEYLKSLQLIKFATSDFIQECLFQTVKDFRGDLGGTNGI